MKILNKINTHIKNEKKLILFSLLSGFAITICVALSTKIYSDRVQRNIAKEVIRFHVLANSDLDYDQGLKLKIRDAILEEYEEILNLSENIDETREILLNNMDEIKNTALNVIEKNGENYPVSISLTTEKFPTINYGDIRFPAGKYETLKIVVGKGSGQNWWCVMFPPLCFVDITRGTISEETKEELKDILGEEEYKLLTSSEDEVSVQIKFKVVEWWQNRKSVNDSIVLN